MDDKQFTREKLRRDLQETLNATDEAITAEGTDEEEGKDLSMCLRLATLTMGNNGLIETFVGKKKDTA
jgi:hypothetical protein